MEEKAPHFKIAWGGAGGGRQWLWAPATYPGLGQIAAAAALPPLPLHPAISPLQPLLPISPRHQAAFAFPPAPLPFPPSL